jgi:hypothetical protein
MVFKYSMVFLGRDFEEQEEITLKNSALRLILDIQTEGFEKKCVEEEEDEDMYLLIRDLVAY